MLLAATTHQPLTPDASWLVYPLSTDHYPLLLHSAPLGRTAAVVRNRRNVPNGTHVQTGGGECAHRRFASRSGAADPHIHATHSVITRLVGGVHCGLLSGKRRSLARTTEAQRTRTLPRHRVSRGIGDGDNGVVEGRLNVHQPVRNVLALLLLELLGLAFLVRSGGSRCFGHELCLPRCFLLVRYRALTRTLAGAGVGVGALPTDGQAAAMTIPTIRTDLDEPLDVHRDVFAQIAFDVAALLDDLTDAVDLIFIEVAHLLGGLHIGRAENALRARIPDAENVRQRDNDVLVARKIHACNTCHSCSKTRGLGTGGLGASEFQFQSLIPSP